MYPSTVTLRRLLVITKPSATDHVTQFQIISFCVTACITRPASPNHIQRIPYLGGTGQPANQEPAFTPTQQ